MVYPSSLENLINSYKKLPTIGEKSAERLALATIEFDDEFVDNFSRNLLAAKQSLRPCTICNNLTDKDVCDICDNCDRNHNLICVIEDYKSVFSFEKTGNFHGVYHVLNGLIMPSKNIGPDDINISSLIRRVEKLTNPEIILALKSSIEAETTIMYIKKIFENKNVTISRLSYGISMGAEIEYLDTITLDKIIEDRKIIS